MWWLVPRDNIPRSSISTDSGGNFSLVCEVLCHYVHSVWGSRPGAGVVALVRSSHRQKQRRGHALGVTQAEIDTQAWQACWYV